MGRAERKGSPPRTRRERNAEHPTEIRLVLLLGVWIGASSCSSPGKLRPFVSDGCSVFPEGTPFESAAWHDHCVEHDLAYWRGGSRAARLAADLLLKKRLTEDGYPYAGRLMYAGVRFGGGAYLPTPWRWGYGWRFPKGYRPLTQEEWKLTTEMKSPTTADR